MKILEIIRKYWKELLLIIAALLVFFFAHNNKVLKEENERITSNYYAVCDSANTFKTKNGLLATKTKDLEVTIDELNARYGDAEKMISEGDEYAKIVYEAMAFGVAKDIAKLSAVVCGKVDRIILTGGIAYSKYIADYITEHVSFIAPVEVMPGEFEMEALAAGALRVLRGEEELQDFGKIAKEAEDRISIIPGVKPGTVPKH